MRIDTTLLREKFVIKGKPADKSDSGKEEVRACSNRIVLEMQNEGLAKETFVIRTNTMHLCTRMAGIVLSDYENRGPFAPRLRDIKWDILWDSALSDYERRYDKSRWVAIYHKGKLIFAEGPHHVFFDVIEQFENEQKEEHAYTRSLIEAEEAFNNAGKKVMIDYASNVALALSMDQNGGRCSTILRAPNKTTAFHYSLKPKKKTEKVVISQGLISAANFLEGINLSYFIGITKARLEFGEIEQHSDEAQQMRNAYKRIKDIEIKIDALENRYAIRYRPERPIFELVIAHTKEYARTTLIENPAV